MNLPCETTRAAARETFLASGGLASLRARGDAHQFRLRGFDDSPGMMTAPCPVTDECTTNGLHLRGAVVSGVTGVEAGLRPCTSLSLHVFNRGRT